MILEWETEYVLILDDDVDTFMVSAAHEVRSGIIRPWTLESVDVCMIP